jgi:L-asparaginase II
MISEFPLSVQVSRHPHVESHHLVDLVVVSKDDVIQAWGDPTIPVMSRSAIKPIQTLPLIRSGAADAFALENHEIALASASHSGEPDHLDAVRSWLSRIGGTTEWLECGATSPIDDDAFLAAGPNYEPIHNCCSGKHTGFLSIASHQSIDHTGYIGPNHPIQKLITESVETFTGFPLAGVTPGIDGCGIPTHPIPLQNIARAMAQLVDPSALDSSWHEPAARVVEALNSHPWWESGTDRHEMLLHQDKKEPLVCKTGAEGVFTAALPDRGLGVACKARDGSKRASDAAITWVLDHIGAIKTSASKLIITNAAGRVVGDVSVKAPQPGQLG